MSYSGFSKAEQLSLQQDLESKYQQFKNSDLSLDLTRGKPSPEQLDLSSDLDGILQGDYQLRDGTDARNYGGILGIPEARDLGAELLDISAEETMVGGNSSLSLMHHYLDFALNKGASGPSSDWRTEALGAHTKVKFLCPIPGYDRHFTLCESFDIEMIPVPLTEAGPDMDRVENLVKSDPLIKGIWCVPKYSNPTGQTYYPETVSRLASLPLIAGKHFRIMWDNAYVVHHLCDSPDQLLNLMDACKNQGTEDNVVMLASTSKITFAGAGIAFLGTSKTNLSLFEKYLSISTIGPDKVNQLRHVRFLKDRDTLAEHMKRHKDLVKPKFDLVEQILQQNLGNASIATWTQPRGGYFVSMDTLPNLASEIIDLAGEAGVNLTPAGSAFPYRLDPENRNIRIAPTFTGLEQLRLALEVLVVSVQLVSVKHFLSD